MNLDTLPIVLLVLSSGVAGLTQIAKYLTGRAGADWSAEVAQVVAAVIASALALVGQAHLPVGIGSVLTLVINQLGAPLTAIFLSAGSYFVHDLAAITQNLLQLLQAKLPPARK